MTSASAGPTFAAIPSGGIASVAVSATPSGPPVVGIRASLKPGQNPDLDPHSVEMREVEDEDSPHEVHMIEVDGQRMPMCLQIEGRSGGIRKLKFTKEQWTVLEKDFKELIKEFGPDADITFEPETQRLIVRKPSGEEEIYTIDNSWPGAEGFVQSLIEFKGKEINPTRYHEYDPTAKGNVKAQKALVSRDRMTERLKNIGLKHGDWSYFKRDFPGNAGITKAASLHKALRESLQEEISQLQAELNKLKGSRAPAAQSHINYLTTNLAHLRRVHDEVCSLDTFAAGWAITHPIATKDASGNPLSGQQILANAKQRQDELQVFIGQEKGNPLSSSHASFAFKGLRNALGEKIKELQPVEVEYARDVVGMNLGGPQLQGESRVLYESFVGEDHIKSDSVEESLLVRYARGAVTPDQIRDGSFAVPGTGVETLDVAIRTRVANKLAALAPRAQPNSNAQPPLVPNFTPPISPAVMAAGGGQALQPTNGSAGSSSSGSPVASTAVVVPGSSGPSTRLVPPPLPLGARSAQPARPATNSTVVVAPPLAVSAAASQARAPVGSAGGLAPPPRSRRLSYDADEFAPVDPSLLARPVAAPSSVSSLGGLVPPPQSQRSRVARDSSDEESRTAD